MTKQRFSTCIIMLGLLPLLAAAPLTAGPLPSDARILTGKLDNGVTWMYRQHDNPPGKMSLMIHVRTGSLNETEKQRGLAHFMEHMMFNGTEHYPPGELIKYYESIGLEFGADINASTGFDRTNFQLYLPDTKTETVDKALMTLSDYAFRALLLDEEINKERGVILEEKRTRQNFRERIRDKLWPELFEGSRLAQRMPIGLEEVIINTQRGEFVKYYRTWYRPENITVILVGDAKPDGIVPLIKKWFGEYKASVPAESPHGAELKPFTKEQAIVVTDPELARCSVILYNLRPGRAPTVTTEQLRTEVVEYIGTWIVSRRCQERVQRGEANYLFAGAGIHNVFNDALFINAQAGGEPAKWAKMLDELIMEINRVQQYGFTARELALARKELLANAEHAVETEPTRSGRSLLKEIVRAVNDREPVLSAKQELDLLKKILPSIQLAELNETYRVHFKPGTYAYVIQTPEKEGATVPPRDDVLASARAAWARKVQAQKAEEVPTGLLTTMPKPGAVSESATDSDLKITSAWLENGVRVHHRYMDYKKDSVKVSIGLAGGRIEETAKNHGVTEAACLAVNQAATSRLNSTNIRDFMTGKNISISAGGRSDDALTISVFGSPKDLETGFQLAHALLTDGKIEQSAFDIWKQSRIQRIEQNQTDLQFKAREALQDLQSGGDPRRLPLTKKDVEALKIADAQAWFERLCREAPIEVAVVGDIKLDDAMTLVRKYLGSLSKRKCSADHLDALRNLNRATGPLDRQVKVDTISPQAMAMVGFVGCEGRSAMDNRSLRIASNILSSRLIKQIREEQALVYSIGASSYPSWTYADSGIFLAGSMCNPENAGKLRDEVHRIFKEFAESGPTSEEMEIAKLQIANNLDTGMREPRYWLRILRYLDLHGRSLDEQKRKKEAYANLTTEQVQKVFKKYYTPERTFNVTAIPTKTEMKEKEERKKPVAQPAS